MKEQESVDLSYLSAYPEVCHPQARILQRTIAWETLRNRGTRGFKQYGKYFAGMWIYGLIYPQQADIIRSAYFWFRHVDDVADNDKPLPSGYENKRHFLQSKKGLIEQLFSRVPDRLSGDREDILLADYYSISKRLGISLGEESLAVLDTIILDEERARSRRILIQSELDDYFDKLDFACIGGALKVAGETASCRDLSSLSWAVRTMFNLRDFPKDLAEGIINISREDIDRYGVDLSKVEGCQTVEEVVGYRPMRRWYEDQTARGISFLTEGKREIKDHRFQWVTNIALVANFAGPTGRILRGYARMLDV